MLAVLKQVLTVHSQPDSRVGSMTEPVALLGSRAVHLAEDSPDASPSGRKSSGAKRRGGLCFWDARMLCV